MNSEETRAAAVSELGEVTMVKLLDHGYLKVVDVWGSDRSIIEAARMSTGKGFLGWEPGDCLACDGTGKIQVNAHGRWVSAVDNCLTCNGKGKHPGDAKLLQYLYENQHSTPFEMAGITIEVQAPIMVFREWHRHRIPFGYNEHSARYAPLPNLNYVPTVERLMASGGSNKQAGTVVDADALTVQNAERFRKRLERLYDDAQQLYEEALGAGVPKELARLPLPVGRYSRMRATGNLRGWLGFMALRSAPQAQWEIRQYSIAISDVLDQIFPRTMRLFRDGRTLDAAVQAVKKKLGTLGAADTILETIVPPPSDQTPP